MTQGPVTAGLVTIVIPTYNDDPEHIHDSVGSALAQSYPMTEVVVVDDGSTRSDSIEALAALDGVRLITQPNSGLSAARNTGIRAGSGEFVLPLDGDDWIERDAVRLLVGALAVDRGVVGAFPLVRRFGAAEGIQHAPMEVRLADIAVTNKVVATCLFRREDWERAGGYDLQDDAPEDWILWIKMLAGGGRLVQVPDAVLHYRLRRNSLNSRYRDADAALRRVAAAAPGQIAELYLAAALDAQRLQVEIAQLRAFHNAWAPRLSPLLATRRAIRAVLEWRQR